MRQGSESGEMHDYSFGLTAFAPWRVGSTPLVPLPGVRCAFAIGYGVEVKNLIWSEWCGSRMNLNTNSFFYLSLFFANQPLVERAKWKRLTF